MNKQRYLLAGVVGIFLMLVLAFAAYGQTAPVTPTKTVDPAALIARITAFSAGVAFLLQGLKKFIPNIQGKGALILSILGAIATAYAAAPAGDVLSVQFLITALGTALGANGIHSFVKLSSGAPPAA